MIPWPTTRHLSSTYGRHLIFTMITLLLLGPSTVVAADFDECLDNIRLGEFGLEGVTDSRGNRLNITTIEGLSNVTSITYQLCVRACGTEQVPFSWTTFSQQFSAWLLPWLALVSQLPFGAGDNFTNLVSMLLAVGSPTLAAYSLAITVLNGRWIAQHFAKYRHPNAPNAVRVLSSLQQAPLEVRGGILINSLITLPENKRWWDDMVERLSYPHTWSISAATSIAWVVIAYIFTVVDSFTPDATKQTNTNGQGVGSLWLWLLAVVIGWLQISPKCDSSRLYHAFDRTNQTVFIAPEGGRPVGAAGSHKAYPFYLRRYSGDILRRDEYCTPPIFNYTRVLPWVQRVKQVSDTFRRITEQGQNVQIVNLLRQVDEGDNQVEEGSSAPLPAIEPTIASAGCDPRLLHDSDDLHGHLESSVMSRMLVASLFALCLSWGTTGAAIVVQFFTPTRGLGCRSGAYTLYGVVSMIVWMVMVLSATLTHYATVHGAHYESDPIGARSGAHRRQRHSRVIPIAAIVLRRVGKVLAFFNALWIVATCIFQFGNLFNNCYCNSSVLGLGAHAAYDVIDLLLGDINPMKRAWIGGIFLAAISTAIFVGFVDLFISPSLPEK